MVLYKLYLNRNEPSLDLSGRGDSAQVEVCFVVVEVHCVSSVEVADCLSKVKLGSSRVGDLEAVVSFKETEAVYE